MNFKEWFNKLYVSKGFVSSKSELEEAWNAAIDEATEIIIEDLNDCNSDIAKEALTKAGEQIEELK